MNRKVELRAEAEIQADIAIVQLEMDLENIKRQDRLRKGCPPGWARVNRENPVQPRKVSVTLRIDRDVATWFWQQGQGYQARMNAVLRAFMLAKKAGAV